MSLNDGGKGIFISPGDETVQELPIRLTAAGSWHDGLTKMLDNPLQLAGRHLAYSLAGFTSPLSSISRRRKDSYTTFCDSVL